ncbi:hypothetical protein PPSIR1_03553 [Plesiocystis pacifica SIR-1]|uniref:SnoaL-like domain-containing protein n=1 Tax=Plesiocystis pacifica SIR-1 TaxID=391625 RepID=A6G5H0_9BACT|nr:hypothetical protein [Plesiocystis pacifica]EDM78913.1 hypothetical protein PPSIR1_03553 [Plesiocystis pacifica SIR-1]
MSPYDVYVLVPALEQRWSQPCMWALARRLRPLLTSLELSLSVLADGLEACVAGERGSYHAHAAQLRAVLRSIEGQLDLIEAEALRLHDPRLPWLVPSQAGREGSTQSRALAVTARGRQLGTFDRDLGRLRLRYLELSAAIGFDLGLGLALCGRPTHARVLDYDALVDPAGLLEALTVERYAEFVEDRVFMRVHQIVEGQLEHYHLLLAEAREGLGGLGLESAPTPRCPDDRAQAAQLEAFVATLDQATRIIEVYADTITILRHMDASDYAPLRVALRDASGALSERARSRARVVHELFQALLAECPGLDLFRCVQDPAAQPRSYRVLAAFERLAAACSLSKSVHAVMVDNMLGQQVLGTLGAEVVTLGKLAAAPVLPELDRAMTQLSLWTLLAHADQAGRVILEQEQRFGLAGKYSFEPSADAASPEAMRASVDAYYGCIVSRCADGWVALFEPERGMFIDPPGTKPSLGPRQLRNAFEGFFLEVFTGIRGLEHQVREDPVPAERLDVADYELAVDWSFHAETCLGPTVKVSGVEVFCFDARGRITLVQAIWDTSAVAREMLELRLAQGDRERAAS